MEAHTGTFYVLNLQSHFHYCWIFFGFWNTLNLVIFGCMLKIMILMKLWTLTEVTDNTSPNYAV